MLDSGVIEPDTIDWASSIVMVAKKEGSLRICVVYFMFKTMVKKDSYPIPRMYYCIDSLGDASMFTTLDAN